MKVLKTILYVFGGLIALLIIITFFLPSASHVECTVEIKAPAAEVYSLVTNLHNWEKWSPWMSVDTTQKLSYDGMPGTVGSSYSWKSDSKELGNGKIVVTDLKQNKEAKYDLLFEGQKFGESWFKLEEKNGMTATTWIMHGELGFFMRWAGIFMNIGIKAMFEKGLANLKKLAESGPAVNIEISISDVPEQNYAVISDKCGADPNEIGAKLGAIYGETMKFIEENKLVCVGPPVVITNSYTEKSWDFVAGFPIKSKEFKSNGKVHLDKLPASKVVKGVYTGPYEESMKAYDKIMNYVKEKNLKINGRMWETYMNDPQNTPKEKLITHIFFPIEK